MKYLITTDNFFVVPDGRYYRAIWGEVAVLPDTFLGLKTNHNSTNWYLKVGSEDNHIIVADCQVKYAIHCEDKPNTNKALDWSTGHVEGVPYVEYERPTIIYIAENEEE